MDKYTVPLGKLPTPTERKVSVSSVPIASPSSPAITPTDGTPLPCHQKNAASFLAGTTAGVMAFYAPEQQLAVQRPHDTPDGMALESDETVRRLVRWREEAPYG